MKRHIRPLRTGTALVVAALSLAVCTAALAAHPKAGHKYAGVTNLPKVVGFGDPVSFTVSANGATLQHFTYGSFGCQGAGGFKPGVNPYTKNMVPVGAIKVGSKGTFSITNSKHKVTNTKGVHYTVVTSTSVSGKFTSAAKASGSLHFSQTYSPQHGAKFTCNGIKEKFTAKVK
jgi:hypothetical protein